jgi:hypothetical protein
MEGFAHERGFFVVDDFRRVPQVQEVDFEYVRTPPYKTGCPTCDGSDFSYTYYPMAEVEPVPEMVETEIPETPIEEDFKAMREFARARGVWKEKRKKDRKRSRKVKQRSRYRRSRIQFEDFEL